MNEALAAYSSGQSDRAEAILNQVLVVSPKEANAFFALGTIAANTGRPAIAIDRFKAAVRLEPRHAQAQFSAGLLLAHLERYEESIPYLEQALVFQPANLQALMALSQSNYHLKQPTRALECLNKALSLNPGDPDLLLARASCLRELLRDGEAKSDLQKALERTPHAEGFALLAEIELEFNRASDSVSSAGASIEIDPSNPLAHTVMARALMSLDRFDEADEHWAKAQELTPAKEELLHEKAKAYISLGRFEQARHFLAESIQANPIQGNSYYSLIASKKCTEEDLPILRQIESLLDNSGLQGYDRLNLLYSLGKANDDLRNFETAIRYFDQANALKKSLRRKDETFNRDQFRRYVDSQIELFTPSFIDEHKSRGNPSTTPLFVVGMMRSGTTLMEQILSCHPRIGGAGEQSFWLDHESEFRNPATGKLNFHRLESLTEEYLQILRSAAPGFERVIDKNPANCLVAGLFAVAYPNGKIVHIRRHPIDTVLSIWMTSMKTPAPFICDRSNIVFAYKQYQRVAEHWRKVIPSDQYLEVEYEALTQDPEQTIRKILEFCELEWDASCLRPDSNKRAVKTPSFWQARQPIYRSSTEKWRNYQPWLGEFEELMPE